MRTLMTFCLTSFLLAYLVIAATAAQPDPIAILKNTYDACNSGYDSFQRLKGTCVDQSGSTCSDKLAFIAQQMRRCSIAIQNVGLWARAQDNLGVDAAAGIEPFTNRMMAIERLANTEQRVCGTEACEATVGAGKIYAEQGNKHLAQKLFRKALIVFTGDDYKGCRQEAEFGLQDLGQLK